MLVVGTIFLKRQMAGWILGPTAKACRAKQNFAPGSLVTQQFKPHLSRVQANNSFNPTPLRGAA